MKSIYFLFIDGLGIAPASSHNPLTEIRGGGLSRIAGCSSWTTGDFASYQDAGLLRRPIDSRLGVAGLPQSGTGQATLFTGINCARIAERHYGPYPHSTSRPHLATSNIFTQVGAHHSAFMNAYPEQYFTHANRRGRYSTTTRCCLESGVRIRTVEDLESGQALSADFTGEGLSQVVESRITVISLREAAKRVRTMCVSKRLVVSEHFQTDKAGHAQDLDLAAKHLNQIDQFVSALLQKLDPSRVSFLITSDHGNIEDLSVKTHTLNPVPLIVRGWAAPFFEEALDLSHIAKGIVDALAA